MNINSKLNSNKQTLIIRVEILPTDCVKINGEFVKKRYANEFVISGADYVKKVIGNSLDTVVATELALQGIEYTEVNYATNWTKLNYNVRIIFYNSKIPVENLNKTDLSVIIDKYFPAFRDNNQLVDVNGMIIYAYFNTFNPSEIATFEDAILRGILEIETLDGTDWRTNVSL